MTNCVVCFFKLHVAYRVITRLSPPHETLTYPTNSDQGVQIVVPSTVLTQEQVTGKMYKANLHRII